MITATDITDHIKEDEETARSTLDSLRSVGRTNLPRGEFLTKEIDFHEENAFFLTAMLFARLGGDMIRTRELYGSLISLYTNAGLPKQEAEQAARKLGLI